MGSSRQLATTVGPITATMYGNGECYVQQTEGDALTVNRIAYTLYGRVHVAADGSVSRVYVNEHGNRQHDTFDITRVDWMTHGSWGAAKGSEAATAKALAAVCAAIEAEVSCDPHWMIAGERSVLLSRRERLERERDAAYATAGKAIAELCDIRDALDKLDQFI